MFRTRIATCAVALGVLVGLVPAVRAADGVRNIDKCQTIDESGPFVVTKNLQAVGDCLVVTANFVTIDLDGHTITGNGTGAGIANVPTNPATGGPATAGASGTTVRNGTITNFLFGVALGVGDGYVIERIRAVNNGQTGIIVITPSNTPGDTAVRDSIASHNGLNGMSLRSIDDQGEITPFALGRGFSVIGNLANANGAIGILVDCPGVVLNNIATSNAAGDINSGFGLVSISTCTRLGNSPAP